MKFNNHITHSCAQRKAFFFPLGRKKQNTFLSVGIAEEEERGGGEGWRRRRRGGESVLG